MDEFEDRLDKALSDFMKDRSEPDSILDSHLPVLRKLDSLRDIPDRDVRVQSINRQAFLDYAKSIPAPVSKSSKQRLKGWKTFFGRERKPMTTVVSIALALMLAFGGVGTTAYAAQDSLPTEFLYPMKELTEQVRLALTTEPEAEMQLLLELTQERVREMVALANSGEDVPLKTQQRLQQQLQLALENAAQLGDPEFSGALERIQTMAQNQVQTMTQVQKGFPADSPCEALELAIQAMNQVRNEAEDGLADPLTFRLRQGTNRPEDAPDQPENEPQGQQNGNQPDGAPGPGQGDGSGVGGGANGNGNGDGSGDGGDVNGNGYGDGSGDGGGAYGDGNGDGICDCMCGDPECDCAGECTPQGPENGPNGPQGGGKQN